MSHSREYRNQFKPADLHPLSCIVLTSHDLLMGYGLLRKNVNPQVSAEYAQRQMTASAYCANAIIKELVERAHSVKVTIVNEQTSSPPPPAYPTAVFPRRIPSYICHKTGQFFVGELGETLADLIARTQPPKPTE